MKRVFYWSLLLMLIFGFQSVSAQQRASQWEIFAGAAIPLSPDSFKDYFKVGGSLHGQYVIFPNPSLGVSFGAAIEGFTFDGDKFLEDFGYSGLGYEIEGSASILELGVGLRPYLTPLEANTQIFLFGVLNYNGISEEETLTGIDFFGNAFTEPYEYKVDRFGIALGAGLEMPAGDRFNIILQGLTRIIFGQEDEEDNISFIGITGGVAF